MTEYLVLLFCNFLVRAFVLISYCYSLLVLETEIVETSKAVREAVSYRGLFTAGWFGVREKHYSRLEIYDRLRANEQATVARF